jgi:hypothetical protein
VLATRAAAAVLEIQVLQAPHIAEAEDAAMSRLEGQMAAAEKAARQSMEQMRTIVPADARSHLTAAAAALDRFTTTNREIVTLSRRNSEVRSLALSLGRKRTLTAECEAQLQGLEDALSKQAIGATR